MESLFSPDGKNLVFTSSVYPECGADDACNKKNIDADAASKVKARIYTELLYRHWTQWQSKRRSHLLVTPVTGGAPKDLTPGTRDVPPFSLGSPDDYDISPDGLEVCYSMNADPVPAVSTNADLFVVSIAGGQARKITSTPGADSSPHYSPDGKYLAWRAQLRAGYESDRWRLMVLDRATGRAHQSDGKSGPVGKQLHLGAGFERALLHHGRPRPPGDSTHPRGRRRNPRGGQRR